MKNIEYIYKNVLITTKSQQTKSTGQKVPGTGESTTKTKDELLLLLLLLLLLFQCISISVIYCIACTLHKKIYLGETGRRLADRFREHVRDVEKNDTDASKPVARHFNLPYHSYHNMTFCGPPLHHGNTESRKYLEPKSIFQLSSLYAHGINERLSFHQLIHKLMSPHFHQWQIFCFTPPPMQHHSFFRS